MKLTVPPNGAGKTLLAFLRDHLKEYPSVKAIKRSIDGKQVTINGRVETFSTHKVKAGDLIGIEFKQAQEVLPPQILFEDEELVVLNKPAGKTSESFQEYFLVHRLDKDTSGVMVFAKTKKMQKSLTDLFRDRKVAKKYIAICDGVIKEKEWVVENYLEKKAAYQGGALYGRGPKERGKKAVTQFERIEASENASLVIARPVTGRTHQVRVHLQGKGHPILGDHQYGKMFECKERPARQMLHSQEISFTHPTKNEELHFSAPLPEDFLEMQKRLFHA